MCSVLFCDVVGFTPLSEARDPEAVRELLSQYFRVARTVIIRYGGVVEKFIGDAVMAVWGTPVATEGDAERAVRAALNLVSAVAELGSEAGVPGLAARAGVVTGEVAVTLGAAGEGMVAGDAVNTASRVQGAAEPGAVLADAATQRLAGRAIGFADAGEHPLKGKAEPVQLWRATRVLSAVGGSQRVDGLEAPLTGRDAELRTVRDLFHAAADRRVSVENLAEALLMTGDWDADEAELAQALDADGLAGIEFLACCRAWLAALRGEVPAAQAILAGLGDLRASDDRQDHAVIALAEALAAPSGREPAAALRHARAALDHAAALGISHEYLRWAWPLAARAAHDLADAAATRELLALLDSCPAGRLAPMQRAERDLARARLAARDGDPAAAVAFTVAIAGLRQHSTLYHLAHGLLDHAGYLLRRDDHDAAGAAIGEARDIAQRLGCRPLLDRAADLSPAEPQIRTPMVTVPGPEESAAVGDG